MSDSLKHPLFSIVIPTYNHAHLIKRCLDSVISQSFSEWEMIIVNNYSEDDTIAIVNSYADDRIKLFNFRNNGVIGASRNYGAKQSCGRWICFLDSDDWYVHGRLEALLVDIRLNQYNLLYHPLIIYKNGKNDSVTPVRQLDIKDPYKDLLYNLNTVATSSTCISRDFFLSSTGFSENKELIGVEDFDLWIRLGKLGMKAKLVNKRLGYYYIGEDNVTYKDERQINRLNAVYLPYINNPGKLSPQKIRSALNYLIARVYLANKKRSEAIAFFFKAFGNGSFAIRVRSIYYLLNIYRK
jgi:glycosyltransferase involved in cell wall biosynthesis